MRLLIVLLIASNISLAQSTIEVRNYYTDLPIGGGYLYINSKKVQLDSLGQFTRENLNDSLIIEFTNSHAYRISLPSLKIDPNKILIYQFDKYRVMTSSIYVLKKSWFGLVKKYTLDAGPIEEFDKHDIFTTRDSLTIKLGNHIYNYSVLDKYRETLKLEILDN